MNDINIYISYENQKTKKPRVNQLGHKGKY